MFHPEPSFQSELRAIGPVCRLKNAVKHADTTKTKKRALRFEKNSKKNEADECNE